MKRIVSYRSLMADGDIQTIPLHTNNGKTGYKITKLELLPQKPGQTDHRFVIQIFKVKPSAVTGTVDFTDNTLLAAGEIEDNGAAHYPNSSAGIVFDNEVFNQDIYVTMKDISTGELCNYYIELEQMDLSEDEALVAIVKNLRNEQ
jgi:hypothetical protein